MKTITISRQYGSGGRHIAALLSEKMGVPCYDSKLLLKEAERHGISQEIINEFKGKTSLLYAIGVMMSEESQDKKRLTIPEKMLKPLDAVSPLDAMNESRFKRSTFVGSLGSAAISTFAAREVPS